MSLFEQQLREETPRSLKALREAENACRRCGLYKHATQAVPGEGPARAPLMLIGEQPGNDEDLDGHPFVGPAGRVLDKALQEAGIDRKQVFVTNAVKHFKHEMRGKRRLHKRPNNYEIERCKIWLDHERSLVKPSTLVALGATAVRSLMGRALAIGKLRGKAMDMPDGTRLVVTVHPSSLLRIQDDEERHAAYRSFVADLKVAAKVNASANAAPPRAR